MELADGIFVNKADGEMAALAETARQVYSRSLHLFPGRRDQWTPRVLSGSAMTGTGIKELWAMLQEFLRHGTTHGTLEERHKQQLLEWMYAALQDLIDRKLNKPDTRELIQQLEGPVSSRDTSPLDAAERIFVQLFGR